MTGDTYVYEKHNTMLDDKLQVGLMYLAHPSTIDDSKIMSLTVDVENMEGVKLGKRRCTQYKAE